MLVDTHAHIYLDAFDEDLADVMHRSEVAGVKEIYLPNIDATSVDRMHNLVDAYPNLCFPMMGLHPCSVKADFKKQLEWVTAHLEKSTRNYIAVGEMGTDLYWDTTFWEEQKQAFDQQCELALHYKLPVVIHCRETIDQTIELVRPWAKKGLSGVFHCFTGTVNQGKAIADLGFYLGLGGVSTFKNGGMDKVIPELAKDKVVLETDSPYLAPAPHRGKRNEPAYVVLVAEKVAEIWSMAEDEVASLSTENAHRLFKPDEI